MPIPLHPLIKKFAQVAEAYNELQSETQDYNEKAYRFKLSPIANRVEITHLPSGSFKRVAIVKTK